MAAVVNKKINTRWFLELLKSQKMSVRSYAREAQEDYSVVHRTFRGKRHFYITDVEKLHRITGASKEDILQNAGLDLDGERMKGVKIAGTIDKKRRLHREKARAKKTTVEAPPGTIDGTLAFRYATGGELEDLEGAVIYCKPLGDDLKPEMLNRWCVVKTRDGDELVRIVRRGHRSGKYTLWLETGEMESDVLIDAAALIEWTRY